MIQFSRPVALAALVAAGLLSAGCERPWQHARTVVTATAHGVVTADAALLTAYESSACEGQQDPAILRGCIEQYESALATVQGIEASAYVGESIVDAWEQAETEPEAWRDWLDTVVQGLARVTAAVEAWGVDVPEELAHWAGVLDSYIERSRP